MSAYGERGFAVFPVEPRGKRPWGGIPWREESKPRAEWGEDWPDGMNVGIDCGKSGLVVLDEDEPGAVKAWLGAEPPTYVVRTGRGRHYYFLATGSPVRNGVQIAPGVDLRADGGYVVGPGSIHENGEEYRVESDVALLLLPAEVVARAVARPLLLATQDVVDLDLTNGPFVLPEVIREGERNDTLFHYASSLVGRRLRDREALILLRDAFARCQPPYIETTPQELWRQVSTRYRTEDDGSVAFQLQVQREVQRLLVHERAKEVVAEKRAAETADEWYGISGEAFDPEAPEPMPCVLEYAEGRFAFAPGIVFLFGARSALKTWLSYYAVVQEVGKGHRALIVDYEMSFEESMRRLYTLGLTAEQAHLVTYVHPSGPPSDAGRVQLLAQFGSDFPTVVVIDSMGMGMGLSGLDSNSDTDSARWAFEVPLWLKAQWPDSVIVLIDHVPKGQTGGAVTDPIGSQRKGAFADGLFLATVLAPVARATRGGGRVVNRKDRKGMHEEGVTLFDYEFGGGGPFVLSEPDHKVVSFELGEEATALVRIAAYVGEHEGNKVETVRNALGIQSAAFTAHKGSLVDQGVIEHRPRQGLFKGSKWQDYVNSTSTFVPDL